ncbi:MAG: glycosyltransferase family 1 protein [Acidaminococcaceae bacterium]|nr:glycosyltransferase family 1 protein [Acidaminococcaceae bacterium]
MHSLPVKVLQIGMTRNHGGLETYLLQQFRALDKTRVTYDFVNITGEYDIVAQEELIAAGCNVFAVNSRHKNPVKHYWQWLTLLRKAHTQYDAIVLNTNSLEYVFPLFAAKLFGIPKRIIHSHNAGFENQIGLLRKLLIRFNTVLLKHSATHYFACSQAAGRWMFGAEADFTVIHNAIEPDKFAFNDEKREKIRHQLELENAFVIGHAGRFSYQKNHGFLINVFAEVVKRKENAILLLIGDYVGDDTYWNQCKKQVAESGLTDKVRFLGARKDVPDLMQAMDCFVLPSRFEGLPLVGIEAQACGLPCFFSDKITREIGITEQAHFIDIKDAKAWADKILSCCQNNRQRTDDEIKAAGYDIAGEIEKVQQFYLNVR